MKFIKYFKQNYVLGSDDFPNWLYNVFYKIAGIINFLLIHKKSKNDIFIFSSFRSGSTWLAEILYKFSNVKYVQEPLSSSKRRILKNISPIKPSDSFLYQDIIGNEVVLKKYITNLSKGKHVISRRYDFLSSSFEFYTNRSVIKILRASAIVEWFVENYTDDYFIILFRHPISCALSKLKSGVKKDFVSSINKYLNDEGYVNSYLPKELVGEIISQRENYSEIEQEIIIWCLDNKPLLNLYNNKNNEKLILLTYEELLISTENVVNFLTKKMDLQNFKNVIHDMHAASASTKYNKENVGNYKNGEVFLNKWKKEISREQEVKIFELIDLFNIDIYQFNESMAQKRYLLNF